MNREQRRQMAKKTGLSQETIKNITNAVPATPMQEGQKVRLNYDRITGGVDYARLQEPYKAFVEAHRDDVFTVAYDKRHKDGVMVCFKEEPRWLWHSSDLVVVVE